MSEKILVDGRPGETNPNYYTTTSNYVPASSTYPYGTSGAQNVTYTTSQQQPVYTTSYQPGYTVSNASYPVGASVVGTTVNTGKEVIKGESRIEYVPFEKKIVEYKDQAKVERVPKKVKKIEYREERKIENIPKEVTVTDYYAVEYLRQYIPQYVPEKRIEYVQVPKKQVRYEYIPVERYFFNYLDKSFITPINLSRWKEELFLDLKSSLEDRHTQQDKPPM